MMASSLRCRLCDVVIADLETFPPRAALAVSDLPALAPYESLCGRFAELGLGRMLRCSIAHRAWLSGGVRSFGSDTLALREWVAKWGHAPEGPTPRLKQRCL